MNVQDKFNEILASFKGVNWQNPGGWPIVVRATVYLAAMALVFVAAYATMITKLNSQFDAEKEKEATLFKDYEDKAFKAMNLDAYKRQLADMEEAFGALLRQLPKDTEVPSLLEDITHTGLGSGLEFSVIDLGTETRKEFYAELPIAIKVQGDYHGFGAFVSGIASLPRIVTLHDFSIVPAKAARGKGAGQGPQLLEMSITARTYRYNDAGADTSDKKKKKGGGKKAPAKEKK